MPKLLPVQTLIVAAAAFLLTASPPTLEGESSGQKGIERSLQDAYGGKTLSLRTFYVGPALEFDSKGSIVGKRVAGSWTLYSRILVSHVELKSQTLEIDGHRLFLHYLPQEKKFKELHGGKVRVRIHLDHEPSSIQDLEPLLVKTFLKSSEDFSELVPSYWRGFLSHTDDPDWSQKQLERVAAESRARDKAETRPLPIYRPEPAFTKEAREAKTKGTVVLSVGIDQYGFVSDTMLIIPVGMGLDESAVETLRAWRFKPAQLNGHTKPVKIVLELTFRTF